MPTSHHTPTSVASSDEWQSYAKQIDGAFVVIVKITAGTYKRRCYFTVEAAQDAVKRANARGENATIFMAELKPLYRVEGGGGDV